jgi:X-Pro dipeptidyl-peptidase
MPTSQRHGLPASVALATALTVGGVPAASATPTLAIDTSGWLTRTVFSYQDAIREHVRVQSPVDSDGDGKRI